MRVLDPDDYEECYECGGEGFVLNDCFEDTCCCADPETSHGFRPCSLCGTRKSQVPEAEKAGGGE